MIEPDEATPPPPRSLTDRGVRVAEWILALVLLWIPTLIWVDVPMSGPTRGYGLPTALRDVDHLMHNLQDNPYPSVNPFYLIYLLPVFCVSVLFGEFRNIDPAFISSLAGTVPFASLAYALGVLGADLIPLLRIPTYVALGAGALSVILGAGFVRSTHSRPRSKRHRFAVAIFAVAVPVCWIVGWVNRPQ